MKLSQLIKRLQELEEDGLGNSRVIIYGETINKFVEGDINDVLESDDSKEVYIFTDLY